MVGDGRVSVRILMRMWSRALAAGLGAVLLVGACTATPAVVPASPSAVAVESIQPSEPAVVRPSPTLVPTLPPRPQPTSACTGRDPKAGVYDSGRLTLLNGCAIVSGTVTLVRHETDGDWHVQLQPDYGQDGVLGAKNITDLDGDLVLRIPCADPIALPAAIAACGSTRNALAIPKVGTHLTATGPLVRDTRNSWNAIQPLWGESLLDGPPPETPQAVLRTRALWARIRVQWPQIPPAVVSTGELPPGTAAQAALYPDGLAHVTMIPSADDHEIWHEAGPEDAADAAGSSPCRSACA